MPTKIKIVLLIILVITLIPILPILINFIFNLGIHLGIFIRNLYNFVAI